MCADKVYPSRFIVIGGLICLFRITFHIVTVW